MPLMGGCMWDGSEPRETNDPLLCESAQLAGSNMSIYCLDRHNVGPNKLFMDTSFRKVGLKELWIFRWRRNFNIAGPWTTAGNAIESDWPLWMQKYEDY